MELEQVYEEVFGKLTSWGETAVEMLPNVLVAVVVVVAFWLVAGLASKTTDRALQRTNTHRAARSLISRFTRIAIAVAGVVVALGVLNLDKALASILAGAGIVGLALGFAFQDLAGNLISGIGLAVNQRWPFKIGDIVETNGVFGIVDEIHLRTSIIRTLDDKMVVVPNRQIFQSAVVNFTAAGTRRVDVTCGVSYGDDLEKVKGVVEAAIGDLPARNESKGVEVFFEEFGGSSINFVARFWVDYEKHTDYLGARSDAVIAIKKAFDENGITIPFPIRTLDFGIVGGERLADVLRDS